MPNLSFFKFSPEQWLTGKIQLLSAVEKGIYIDLAARIWQAGGSLENSPVLHRVLRVEKGTLSEAFQSFIELDIMQMNDGFISMKFITEQRENVKAYLKRQSEFGSLGGRPKGNPSEKKGYPFNPEGNPSKNKGCEKGSKANKDKDKDIEEDLKENIKEKVQLRISELFHRRQTTPWSDKEKKQLREICKRPEVISELDAIENLYKSGYIYRRRDILTLLNNWTVELDRASARAGQGNPGGQTQFTTQERNDNADIF